MKNNAMEEEVVVHPIGGMQLSEGYIRRDRFNHFKGGLPGIEPQAGDTLIEVLERLERKAKAYYGDDVVVEVARHA